MATVTGMTAERMLAIEAASVIDGDVVGDNLILTQHDGTQINAGSVRGPEGEQGPVGEDTEILVAVSILDVGMNGQIRAGRQLTAADFTNMGLSAPIGLWNLSDLTDASGHGRALLNKGAVPLTTGINGKANTAAQFKADASQALYIPDSGAADPFRIKMGSWGCWFKQPPQPPPAGNLNLMGKLGTSAGTYSFWLQQQPGSFTSNISFDGTGATAARTYSNVWDNRWHFVVSTYDGSNLRLYMDGVLADAVAGSGPLFSSPGPFNIGAFGADSSTSAVIPFNGCADEAFVTADVLSEDQIHNLYCAKIPHSLAAVPSRLSLNVHRRRRGAALAVADFPTPPLRLYNFSGGSLGDEGSNNQPLTNTGGAVNVPGADGSAGNAFAFTVPPQTLSATDAGLPSGLAARSYGLWFKSKNIGGMSIFGWGGASGATDARMINTGGPGISSFSGADEVKGPTLSSDWHFLVVTNDNAALDGIKHKLYVDGKAVGSSKVLNPITLGGAGHFCIGANVDGSYANLVGQVDGVFVCDYALSASDIMRLYSKSLLAFSPSPKSVGEHIEGMSSTDLFVAFDTLEPQHVVDLTMAP